MKITSFRIICFLLINGMTLDIYVISAGAIDKARWYGSMDSEVFKRQFPNGFDPIYQKAKAMGTRLGTWGGPDGFGDTPEEEEARIDMMVKRYASATIDGKPADALIKKRSLKIEFPGEPLKEAYHRKIADLMPCELPEDAEALYEATVFAADNNALG